MKTKLLVALSLVLLTTFGTEDIARAQGEITESVTVSLFATTMTLPLGPHGTYVAWESYGVVASDTGEGLFHGATNRCVGAFFSAQGTVEGEGYSDSVIAGKHSPCLPIPGSPYLAFRRCGGEFAT